MRARELFEAPLAGYELFGDWSDMDSHTALTLDQMAAEDVERAKNSFVSKYDRALVVAPKTQEGLRKLLRHLKRPIYVFLLNAPAGLRIAQDNLDYGRLVMPHETEARSKLGDNTLRQHDEMVEDLGPEIKARIEAVMAKQPKAIIFVLTHNEGGDLRHPLTPWLIAHRMAHASEISSGDILVKEPFESALQRIGRHYYAGLYGGWVSVFQVLRNLCTFRAAREDNILNDEQIELVCEMMVQYMALNGIKLHTPEELHIGGRAFPMLKTKEAGADERLTELQSEIAMLSRNINAYFAKKIASMDGQVFVC